MARQIIPCARRRARLAEPENLPDSNVEVVDLDAVHLPGIEQVHRHVRGAARQRAPERLLHDRVGHVPIGGELIALERPPESPDESPERSPDVKSLAPPLEPC